jgi:hypothetical protein
MIDFPNHSRSYDASRHAVRFWGHDSAIEASFFIDEDALARIHPGFGPMKSGFLNAFDANRDKRYVPRPPGFTYAAAGDHTIWARSTFETVGRIEADRNEARRHLRLGR